MAYKPFIPALVWASIIFIAISIPGSYMPRTELSRIPNLDKFVHFGMFAVFGILLSYGFHFQKAFKLSAAQYAFITLMVGVFYGGITELMQYFLFPMRHGNIFDFLANGFGTIFGILLFVVTHKSLIGKKRVSS